ncbi:hypothetical protein V6N13_038333 [Hibiscus sabdariffa]|uniref:Uncharacterized protein n=1 Tax=Hibiscus sabdariffa TaxID=183260 RepID=A0ABR2S2A8_9ROSI
MEGSARGARVGWKTVTRRLREGLDSRNNPSQSQSWAWRLMKLRGHMLHIGESQDCFEAKITEGNVSLNGLLMIEGKGNLRLHGGAQETVHVRFVNSKYAITLLLVPDCQ